MRMTRDDDNTTILEMDNSTAQQLSHQNGSSIGGGQLGGGINNSSNNTGSAGGGVGGLNNKQVEDNQANSSNGHQYTMPGVLHYIQHEFSRFEMERSQWDIDRAELQVNKLFKEKKKYQNNNNVVLKDEDFLKCIQIKSKTLQNSLIKMNILKIIHVHKNVGVILPQIILFSLLF